MNVLKVSFKKKFPTSSTSKCGWRHQTCHLVP